jgi:hypothetical protein
MLRNEESGKYGLLSRQRSRFNPKSDRLLRVAVLIQR